MATYTIFKLKNMSPLHIGTGRENYDFSASQWQSDSISAALAAMRSFKGKTEDIKEFLDSFVISSAFPYVNDCFFFPKPQGKLSVIVDNQMEEYQYRKMLKRVKFIEYTLWQDLVSGKVSNVDSQQLQGDFLLPSDIKDFEKPMLSQINQRVSVPRYNDDAQPFFFDWIYFRENAGLFFLVQAEKDITKELYSLLESLGEVGIGTDKNVGGGKFDVEVGEVVINDVQNNNASLLLSTYIPTKEELSQLNLSNAKYELIRRDGYMAGSSETDFCHLRKKSIYMFNVGSVFLISKHLKGTIVDLKPDWNDERMHPVYRSGKPFVLPINLNEDE